MRRLFLAATTIVSLPNIAGAECVNVTISARDALATADVVFSGTVTKIEDPHAPGLTQVVTFAVDRVWKGPAGKQQVIHHQVTVDSRTFQTGDTLVVFGRQLGADSRERVGLPREGAPAYGYQSLGCGVDLPLEFNSELPQLPSVKVP